MRFITAAQKHISTFISHSAENNDEAKYYEALLKDEGFSVFQYGHGLNPGERIRGVADRINRCHFFLFIVSDDSLESKWVQRELGLALALQEKNRGYKPIIIPLYAKNSRWRKSGKRPTKFPTRNFDTGKKGKPFDLDVRGLDQYANPEADNAADVLVSLMKPSLLVTRVDFDDEATFNDTDVFRLYEQLFPRIEQDDREDIIHWVLRSDLGKERKFVLRDRTTISYTLDSRYCILCLANRAIGLAFFTFDHSSKLMYGNYVAIQECWRGGDIANVFVKEIMRVFETLFPEYGGVIFEVERFDKDRIGAIIGRLEKDRTAWSDDDRAEIRKFLRVCWYHKIRCFFFCEEGGRPLVATSPCLDPREEIADWEKMEEDYWIMWFPRWALDMSDAKALWARAVNCIYV